MNTKTKIGIKIIKIIVISALTFVFGSLLITIGSVFNNLLISFIGIFLIIAINLYLFYPLIKAIYLLLTSKN